MYCAEVRIMYCANVIILSAPFYVTEHYIGKRSYVEAKTVKALYYNCYSLARMLSNLTQKTVTFQPYKKDENLFCAYVSPRIFVHPRKISYYDLPDI